MTETLLNKFPSYDECKDAVFQIKKKDKSPGFDGISSEFYPNFLVGFWAIILCSFTGNI